MQTLLKSIRGNKSTAELVHYWLIRGALAGSLLANLILLINPRQGVIEPTSISMHYTDVHSLVALSMMVVDVGLALILFVHQQRYQRAFELVISFILSVLLLVVGIFVFTHAELDPSEFRRYGLPVPIVTSGFRFHLGKVLGILLLLGSLILALFRARSRALRLIADVVNHVIGVASITYLVACSFHAQEFSGPFSLGYLSPGLGTSMLLFSACIFGLNSDVGFGVVFFSAYNGGQAARWLIPVAVITTMVLGYAALLVADIWSLSTTFVLLLFNGAMITTLTSFVRFVGGRLDRVDKARVESEWALRKLNEELESRVVKRTAELSAVQQQLSVIIEHSNEALALIDDQGIVRFVNKAGLRVGDYELEDRINKPRLDIVHDDDKELVKSAVVQAKTTLYNGIRVDHRLLTKDKQIRWVTGTLTAFKAFDGTVNIVANFHDITRERAIEEQLRQKLDMMDRMEKTAHVGGWSLRGSERRVEWTDEVYRIYEVPINEIPTQQSATQFIAEEAREQLQAAVENCRRTGTGFDFELPFISAKGNEKRVRILGVGVPTGSDCFDVFGTMQDVTERTRIENRLARSINEVHDYKVALDESSIVAITNRQGVIIHVNENFCKISGYSAQELIGKDHRVVNSSYHPKEFFREMWRTISHGKVWHGEIRNKAKNGEYYWVDTTIVPFLDEVGKPYEYLAIRADISERKKAEARIHQYMLELERSNQELEQFAYIASHDLQEPLRMVGSYMDLLRRRYGPSLDKDAREFVDFAVDGASRMKQLVNDLLQYSRINRASEASPVDCGVVVERVLRTLKARIDESGANIVVDSLPVVMADETQMVQLFQNLIANAIKFRRDGVDPQIHISARAKDGRWQFEIEDNGIGIEKKYADKVFVIFRQLHDKSRYEGTGIGLAVAKRIVERYHGTIWFESVYGSGTTFFFTLPGDE